jgi:hypothetical protein
MSIDIMLVDNSPADCDNAGPACYGCPYYDSCPQHFEDDLD